MSDVYLLMYLGALADFASDRGSASFWRDFTLNLDLMPAWFCFMSEH